jgi:hypothetical protein
MTGGFVKGIKYAAGYSALSPLGAELGHADRDDAALIALLVKLASRSSA